MGSTMDKKYKIYMKVSTKKFKICIKMLNIYKNIRYVKNSNYNNTLLRIFNKK